MYFKGEQIQETLSLSAVKEKVEENREFILTQLENYDKVYISEKVPEENEETKEETNSNNNSNNNALIQAVKATTVKLLPFKATINETPKPNIPEYILPVTYNPKGNVIEANIV